MLFELIKLANLLYINAKCMIKGRFDCDGMPVREEGWLTCSSPARSSRRQCDETSLLFMWHCRARCGGRPFYHTGERVNWEHLPRCEQDHWWAMVNGSIEQAA